MSKCPYNNVQASSSSSTSGAEDASFESANYAADQAVMRGANIPWRLAQDFIQNVFMDGGANAKGAIGNTKSRGWGTSEGLVTDNTGNVAEFCDGIADWWPDVSVFWHTISGFLQ